MQTRPNGFINKVFKSAVIVILSLPPLMHPNVCLCIFFAIKSLQILCTFALGALLCTARCTVHTPKTTIKFHVNAVIAGRMTSCVGGKFFQLHVHLPHQMKLTIDPDA